MPGHQRVQSKIKILVPHQLRHCGVAAGKTLRTYILSLIWLLLPKPHTRLPSGHMPTDSYNSAQRVFGDVLINQDERMAVASVLQRTLNLAIL